MRPGHRHITRYRVVPLYLPGASITRALPSERVKGNQCQAHAINQTAPGPPPSQRRSNAWGSPRTMEIQHRSTRLCPEVGWERATRTVTVNKHPPLPSPGLGLGETDGPRSGCVTGTEGKIMFRKEFSEDHGNINGHLPAHTSKGEGKGADFILQVEHI